MFKLDDLNLKTRKQLQKLSKENNLKANGKNAEMIQRLMLLTIDTTTDTLKPVNLGNTTDTLNPGNTEKANTAESPEKQSKLDEQEERVKARETPKKVIKSESIIETENENKNTPRTSKRIADQETKSLDRGSYAIKKHKGDTPKSASHATVKSKIPGTRKYGFVRKFPVSNPSLPQVPLQSIPLPRDNPQKDFTFSCPIPKKFDLSESLKKPLPYKPHTGFGLANQGPLPPFGQ